MISHILLATDFSTRSDRALRRATMLARQQSARLSLVHVVEDDQPLHLIKAQISASRPLLEESARTIEDFDGIAADARIVTGDVSSAIIEAADEADAGLIVLGSHRRQLRDVFVGTTAERTVAQSRRPVLMAAGVPSAPYARTLVAFDLEEGSRTLAKRIQEMGIFGTSEVVAMHAFDAPARGMMQRAMSDRAAIDEYLRDEGVRAAEDFRRFLTGTGLRTTRHRPMPLNGTPARTIRECAGDEDAALIVVGASQRKGIERFILGSVAEDVLGNADRDVLVVPT
jgi:nucleotide-binding universal stress UspA family protein